MNSSDKVEKEEVEDALRLFDDEIDASVEEWNMFQHAHRGEFWKYRNRWSGLIPGIDSDAKSDPFPVKVEVNRVWPFVQTHVSNLFMRAPRAALELPAVDDMKSGRKPNYQGAVDRVTAFDNEWIKQGGFQPISTLAMQRCLFHGRTAFKLGMRPSKKRAVRRVWVSTVPYWGLLLDDRAETEEEQAYRGHIRYERVDAARRIVGEGGFGFPADDELTFEALPDVVESENRPDGWEDRHRIKKYVRLLEFYDLLANEQRFYLVEGRNKFASIREVGQTRTIPWKTEDQDGVPILPLVLSNEADKPLRGIPAIRRIYQINAEQNLILTIVANKLRRDAATITTIPEGMPQDFIDAVRNAEDGAVVAIPTELFQRVRELWRHLDPPQFAQSLDRYAVFLGEAFRDTSGLSEQMQGRQGKYLSATESEIVASAGETLALEISSRMSEVMARVVEFVNVVIGEGLERPLQVKTPDGWKTLTKEDLLLPWLVDIVDAGTTPLREQKRKAELAATGPALLEYTRIASSPDAPTAGPDGQPVAGVTPEVRRMAQLLLDLTVQAHGFPQEMTWQALSNVPKPETSGPTPEELAAASSLMDRAIGTGGPPPTPGV